MRLRHGKKISIFGDWKKTKATVTKGCRGVCRGPGRILGVEGTVPPVRDKGEPRKTVATQAAIGKKQQAHSYIQQQAPLYNKVKSFLKVCEHTKRARKAFGAWTSVCNEFSQKGSTKQQKTQHTRMYEGHGATKAPKRHKEQVFECESTPKELIVRMRHNLHVQKHFLAPWAIFHNAEAFETKTLTTRVLLRVTRHQ